MVCLVCCSVAVFREIHWISWLKFRSLVLGASRDSLDKLSKFGYLSGFENLYSETKSIMNSDH